ncbi:MAG: cytochrome c3 family protein [Desulfovibrionaceae bacterium]|nr:cytochrome c3 family protein [Desulfovibrionaceae bacterium]
MIEKRFVPIVVLTGILAAVAVIGYLLPEQAEEVPKRVSMLNTGGPVVFEHRQHESLAASCMDCHHDQTVLTEEEREKSKPLACSVCHGITVDKEFIATHESAYRKFGDKTCLVCHHYVPGKQDWGHAVHVEEFEVECTTCHHSDTSIEETPSNCADCHEEGAAPSKTPFEEGVPPSLADAVHSKCASCHQDWFDLKARGCVKCHFDTPPDGREQADRLHVNMEDNTCVKCHSEDFDKLIPNRMTAQHVSCMGCHKKVDKGPRTGSDCSQCHMK